MVLIRPKTVFVPIEHKNGLETRAEDLPILADIDHARETLIGPHGRRQYAHRKLSYVESDDPKHIDEFMVRRRGGLQ